MLPPFEDCYRAVLSRETRFDGWFFTAVTSTGIYCRPSCPAVTPKRANVRFYPTAAAAQQAGFRACLRCRPDSVPGSPAWNPAGDVASRAIRMIEDGLVEREGVAGLAFRLGYSARQLNRILSEQLGAGPLTLARAARAHTARVLLQTTGMPIADVAFAAGFGSVRQFNDTVRSVFAAAPQALRDRAGAPGSSVGGVTDAVGGAHLSLRLPFRPPYDQQAMLSFLSDRMIPGVEELLPARDGASPSYRRVLRLHHGLGVVQLKPGERFFRATIGLDDPRDLTQAIARCRRLLHTDADPDGIVQALGDDPLIGGLVRARPGLRIPGSTDIFETVVRAVIGQQVSIAGARTVAGRLVARYGQRLAEPSGELRHAFCDPAALVELDPAKASMPRGRAHALIAAAKAVLAGVLPLQPGSDPELVRSELLAIPGIGAWTAEYVALRGLGSPDAFPATDLGIRRAITELGVPDRAAEITRAAAGWRPLRAYAAQHLWTWLSAPTTEPADRRNQPITEQADHVAD